MSLFPQAVRPDLLKNIMNHHGHRQGDCQPSWFLDFKVIGKLEIIFTLNNLLELFSWKALSTLLILSIERIIIDKVIGELKYISKVNLFPFLDLNTLWGKFHETS